MDYLLAKMEGYLSSSMIPPPKRWYLAFQLSFSQVAKVFSNFSQLKA
jgi:hypothetical protein